MTKDIDSLIVRNLADIQRTSDRINNEIEPAVAKAFDDIVKNWADDRDWEVPDDSFDEDGLTIHPAGWAVGDDDYIASFAMDSIEDEWSNFWLSDICGASQGGACIRWLIDLTQLGLKKGEWKKFLKDTGAVSKIQMQGFSYDDRSGTFFLPFVIAADSLASAIENEAIEDALDPLRKALETVGAAVPAFEQLIADAQQKAPMAKQRSIS